MTKTIKTNTTKNSVQTQPKLHNRLLHKLFLHKRFRMPARCGACLFRDSPDAPPTAAFVLAFGPKTTREILQRAASRAARAVVPQSSAYCETCRRVTWMARSTELTDALVLHEYDHRIAVQILLVQNMK